MRWALAVIGMVLGCSATPPPDGATPVGATAPAATVTSTATVTSAVDGNPAGPGQAETGSEAWSAPGKVAATAGALSAVRVDVQGLIQAGCAKSAAGRLDCSKPKVGADPGCFIGVRVDDGYGGLGVSVGECDVMSGKGGPALEGLAQVGCMVSVYRRLVVAEGGKLAVIATPAEMKKRFAPIDTAEKAFSYALVQSLGEAQFAIPPGMTMFAKDVAPSDVREVAEGFEVRLFEKRACGCGPHETEEVVYLVTKAGDVREARRRRAWNDPATDGLCVD